MVEYIPVTDESIGSNPFIPAKQLIGSSEVERILHTDMVGGSNPPLSTI